MYVTVEDGVGDCVDVSDGVIEDVELGDAVAVDVAEGLKVAMGRCERSVALRTHWQSLAVLNVIIIINT